MMIKTKAAILGALSLAAIVMSAEAISEVTEPSSYKAIPDEVKTVSENTESRYRLRELNGYIAVFAGDDDSVPVDITDIEVQTLNDTDRELLRLGIAADSKTELLCLLEDLGS